jgi:inorganic pyrophosphatase
MWIAFCGGGDEGAYQLLAPGHIFDLALLGVMDFVDDDEVDLFVVD